MGIADLRDLRDLSRTHATLFRASDIPRYLDAGHGTCKALHSSLSFRVIEWKTRL